MIRRFPTTAPGDLAWAARSSASVLLTGDLGEALAVARWIHDESARRGGPFIVIDCAGPPATVLDRLLQVLGSRDRHGWTRGAAGGTLYLKEVGALPLNVQQMLAELMDRRGRSRIVAATSEPLMDRVSDGYFDDCLYYRLNAIHLIL